MCASSFFIARSSLDKVMLLVILGQQMKMKDVQYNQNDVAPETYDTQFVTFSTSMLLLLRFLVDVLSQSLQTNGVGTRLWIHCYF